MYIIKYTVSELLNVKNFTALLVCNNNFEYSPKSFINALGESKTTSSPLNISRLFKYGKNTCVY